MAQAKECDRCEILYKPYNLKCGEFNGVCKIRIDKEGRIEYTGLKKDLCPECMQKYIYFIDNRDNLENDLSEKEN